MMRYKSIGRHRRPHLRKLLLREKTTKLGIALVSHCSCHHHHHYRVMMTMIIGMIIIIVYLFRASQEPHDWAAGSPTGAEHVAVPVNPDEFPDLRHIDITIVAIFF